MIARVLRILASPVGKGHRILGEPCAIAPVEPDRGSSLPEGGERKAAAQAGEYHCSRGRNSWSKFREDKKILCSVVVYIRLRGECTWKRSRGRSLPVLDATAVGAV